VARVSEVFVIVLERRLAKIWLGDVYTHLLVLSSGNARRILRTFWCYRP